MLVPNAIGNSLLLAYKHPCTKMWTTEGIRCSAVDLGRDASYMWFSSHVYRFLKTLWYRVLHERGYPDLLFVELKYCLPQRLPIAETIVSPT